MTQTVTINRFRTVPANLTGIGWVAVQQWDNEAGNYVHMASFRSETEADRFKESMEARPAH